MTNPFTPGTYTGRLSSGPSGQFTVTVTRVTNSFVFITPCVGQPACRRRVIHAHGSIFFYPLGQFSHAPIITMDRRDQDQ